MLHRMSLVAAPFDIDRGAAIRQQSRAKRTLVSGSIREDGPPVQKFGSLNKVHSRGLTDMTLGLLDRGAWQADDPTRIKDGHFIRPPTTYHNFITADGRPGPTGQGDFPAEAGRYHLYVSLACPWAHRTLIFRSTLEAGGCAVSVVEPVLGNRGWEFGAGPGATLDTVNGKSTLAEIYILTESALYRPGDCTRVVGQEPSHYRQ